MSLLVFLSRQWVCLSSCPGGVLLILLFRRCFFLSSCLSCSSSRSLAQVLFHLVLLSMWCFFLSSCPGSVSSCPLVQAVCSLGSVIQRHSNWCQSGDTCLTWPFIRLTSSQVLPSVSIKSQDFTFKLWSSQGVIKGHRGWAGRLGEGGKVSGEGAGENPLPS